MAEPRTSLDRPEPPAPSSVAPALPMGRRDLWEEVLVVLALSLLASAVFAVISLLSAPVNRSVSVAAANQDTQLANQVASIVFGLAPVALVFHLVRRSGEGLRPFGLASARPGLDVAWGVAAGLAVSGVGLGIYLAAEALGINRFVVPVPPLGHWWTVPILLLTALQNGLLEEVIVVGYLVRRLEQLGWATPAAVLASAALRGSYHLYQGWGGFGGNLLLGLFLGFLFVRWRRTWPLVVAHFTVDALAGLAYIAFRGHCVFGTCIR